MSRSRQAHEQMTANRPNAANAADIVIENLSLSFGTTEVLKEINLTIEKGEFFTFLGPSGSGKSTLLRAIAGFGPTPGGRILVDGEDITALPPWKRNVGMVFQSYALWPHMTVRKNIAFGLQERKVAAKEIGERVEAILEMIGLSALAERRPSQLSGGQQQRVALARTLVVEPRVLLLDEPLSNLDANLRVQMRREIVELQRKLSLTTVFVTHDQEEANTTSDRIAVLNDGVIHQVGAPMTLYDHPANRFVAGFLGAANLIEGSVERVADGLLFRAAEGFAFPIAGQARPGEVKMVMIRPQAITILSPGPISGPIPGGPASTDKAGLRGRIAEHEFLGNLIRYTVIVGQRALYVDDNHQAGRLVHEPGATVELQVDPQQVCVLESN